MMRSERRKKRERKGEPVWLYHNHNISDVPPDLVFLLRWDNGSMKPKRPALAGRDTYNNRERTT
jgi:hypothetical protein